MEINDLDKQLTKLEQIVKDGFKASDKSFKEVIKRQDHTNGAVASNQKELARLHNENEKMKAVASIFRFLSVLVIVPSIGYLLVCYMANIEKNAIMAENIKQLYVKQTDIEDTYQEINESIAKYLIQ